MENNMDQIFTRTRSVTIGGESKQQLLKELQKQSIMLNEYAEKLFDSTQFTISGEEYILNIVEVTVGELGFSHGEKMEAIIYKAKSLGLKLCPMELAPYLRLAYRNQSDGNNGGQSESNKAPDGSITVVSKALFDDDDFPKGFYLRKIDGVLWLRGYIADNEHIWNAGDRLIFTK